MKTQKIPTQPYKGARDFYPVDMQIRNHIFNTWRKVCKKFGYEEYDGPFLESFDLYAAKSGEEIVNEQLYSFTDRGDRKVAIRPEMTPTLARMVAGQYKTLNFPVRWFSMPNLWRYEKPQKGRLREHFQLNVDTFGLTGIEADFEIITLLIALMKEFGATDESFKIKIGNRRFIEDIYKKFGLNSEQALRTSKAIDKRTKITLEEFKKILKDDAKLEEKQIGSICQFLENPQQELKAMENMSEGAQEVKNLLDLCKMTQHDRYVEYDPVIMRGFDYYTGNVFELFDLNPENSRAMCGGGRYDDLVSLFIEDKIPGVGFGMGDVTLRNFLEEWNLLPRPESSCEYFVTLWPSENKEYLKATLETAKILREKGKSTETWLENNTKLDKQLRYANKKQAKNVIIIGENELKQGLITVKNLLEQTQKTVSLEDFLSKMI